MLRILIRWFCEKPADRYGSIFLQIRINPDSAGQGLGKACARSDPTFFRDNDFFSEKLRLI